MTRDELLDSIDTALEQLDSVFAEEQRGDLCARVAGARARLDRPTTVVCVVGEFKQGKSSLVNAIVGADVCPVDDDIATSVLTLVRHGEQPGAVVRRRTNGEASAERMSVEAAGEFVCERSDGRDGVERVDILVPSAALAAGLALVDTPGAGGVRAGHGAATLAFLPFADGMVFVSDGTGELSQPELDFLCEARSGCPHVVVALTKTDIAPEWRRIRSLNEGHLQRLGLDIPIFPVTSELHRELAGSGGEPGVVALLAALDERIVQPARSSSASRIGAEVAALVRSVGEGLEQRRVVLEQPSALADLEARVAAAVQRIEHLRGPAARWNIALGDRMTDLSSDAGFQFRAGLRELLRTHEESIETLKTAEQWEAQAGRLQDDLSAVVTRLFVAIEEGRRAVRDDLLDLLAAEDEELGGVRGALSLRELSVTDLWKGKPLDTGSLSAKAVQTGLTGLRGAQSGIMLFGMTSQFLPAAAATFLVSNPVLLAVGAVFGGYQLYEDRKRKVTMRRQSARTQLRQFTDDVQFEVTNEMGVMLRTAQRDLRDEFTSMLGELQRTWTESVNQARAALASGSTERALEIEAIERHAATLRAVDAAVAQAVSQLSSAEAAEEAL